MIVTDSLTDDHSETKSLRYWENLDNTDNQESQDSQESKEIKKVKKI